MTPQQAVQIYRQVMTEARREVLRLARAFPVGDPRREHLLARAPIFEADANLLDRLRPWPAREDR